MRRYLAGRLLQAVGVVLLVTTLTFVLLHLAPGDPIRAALDRPGVTEAVREQWRVSFGLDRPIGEQYVRWIANAAQGDLGYSLTYRLPVREVLAITLPRTLLLTGLGFSLSFALGVFVAVLQTERAGGARDRWLGRTLLFLYSVPDFWFGLIVLLVFAYWLRLLPSGGIVDPVMHDYLGLRGRMLDRLAHLTLPVVTLALLSAAVIARYQRSALLAVFPEEWMRTALAKGLSWRSAVRRHALRNALIPTITLAGLTLPAVAGGTVLIERVFSWPGMGWATVNGIAARDYPLVTAGVLVISVVVVIGTLVADLAVAVVDPRIRVR